MQGYRIDPFRHLVEPVSYESLRELQDLVGGQLQLAYMWDNGDTLFVDEDGLAKRPIHFFSIPERPDQLLASYGVLVGPEIDDETTIKSQPPLMSIETLQMKVTYACPATGGRHSIWWQIIPTIQTP